MALSTKSKRAFLRYLKIQSESSATAFLAQLNSYLTEMVEASKGGKFLTSAGGNGHSVVFTYFGAGVTPMDMVELISQLLDLYDTSRSYLVSAGTATPNDAQIFAEMMRLLVPIKTVTGDFSSLRQCA